MIQITIPDVAQELAFFTEFVVEGESPDHFSEIY